MSKRKFKPGVNIDHEYRVAGGVESAVTIADYPFDDGQQQIVQFHPWDRGPNNRAVYVQVGYVTKKGYAAPVKKKQEGPKEWTQAHIVDRDDFVEAILAVFPELTRA